VTRSQLPVRRAAPQQSSPLVVRDPAQELMLDPDACIEIPPETGLLSSGTLCVVDLGKIPDCLNVKETERFLRESGAGICGGQGVSEMISRSLSKRLEKLEVRLIPDAYPGEVCFTGWEGCPRGTYFPRREC
jgi:hypothetical protein